MNFKLVFVLSLAGSAVCFSTRPASSAPVDYAFTRIVSNGDNLGNGELTDVTHPAINNRGEVVFFSETASGDRSINTWTNGQFSRIVSDSSGGLFSRVTLAASINDSGLVAFIANTNAGNKGIYTTSDGSSFTTIVDTSGPIDRLWNASNGADGIGPSLNNLGQVAFWAKSAGIDKMFLGDGSTMQEIDSSSTYRFGPRPGVNDAGHVVYIRGRTAMTSNINFWNGTTTDTIVSGAPYFSFSGGLGLGGVPALDNNDRVGFMATPNDRNSESIFVFEDNIVTEIVSNSGSGFDGFERPYFNEVGGIIFNGRFSSRSTSIATGPDSVSDLVVRTDDTILGSVVGSPRVYRGGFNDLGQVVFRATFKDGTPTGLYLATPATSQTLIPKGALWKYLDDGSNQGVGWTASSFDDSAWQQGPGELGYGDGEATTVRDSRGTGSLTTYFRHYFSVDDPASVLSLELGLLRDDGVAVYLNGTEIVRDKLDPGARFNDFATGSAVGGQDESTYFPFGDIDPSLLVAGENVLAVEIHQASYTSSDISFDLELTAKMALIPEPAALALATLGLFGLVARGRRRRMR